MHLHERWVLDNLVGKVDAERVAREAEAEPHGAVLTAERDVGVQVEDRAVLAQVGLVGDRLDVVLAVLDESAVGERAAVLQQPHREPGQDIS